MYYFSARYYSPELGKFTSVDPVPSEPAYSYVYNNPLTYVDPTGTQTAAPPVNPITDPTMIELNRLMRDVSRTPYRGPAAGAAGGGFWAATGAVLAGFFLTSGPFQAQLQGNHPFHDPFGTLNHLNPVYFSHSDDAEEVERFLHLHNQFKPHRRPMERFEHTDGRVEYSSVTQKDIEEGNVATFSIGIKRLQTTGAALGEITSKGHQTSTYEFKINRADPIMQHDIDPLLSDLVWRLEHQFGLSSKEAIRVSGEIRFFVNNFRGTGMPEMLHNQIISPVPITQKGWYKESGHELGIAITNINIPGERPNYMF